MQLTLPTFQWLQSKTGETLEGDALFDKEVNVRYGTLFLRLLKEEFGTTRRFSPLITPGGAVTAG